MILNLLTMEYLALSLLFDHLSLQFLKFLLLLILQALVLHYLFLFLMMLVMRL